MPERPARLPAAPEPVPGCGHSSSATAPAVATAAGPAPCARRFRDALDYAVGKPRVTGPRVTSFPEEAKSERHEAVLARGTRHRPAGIGVEVSLPCGDYYFGDYYSGDYYFGDYFMEALPRVLKPREVARAIGL